MSTWIVLLRGINVGGKNALPMATLRALLEDLRLRAPRTYIQSGNAVFEAARVNRSKLTTKIEGAIDDAVGFTPRVMLLTLDEFRAAADALPWDVTDPKTAHLFFFAEPPESPDLDALRDVATDSEKWHLGKRAFYLHAPDGIARSKLASSVERRLGVPVTARNLRTVDKLRELAEG